MASARIHRLEELTSLLHLFNNSTDRNELRSTIQTVMTIVNQTPHELERSNVDDEVMIRFMFSRLSSFIESSDLGEHLSDEDIFCDTMNTLEARLDAMQGSSFVEKMTWLLSVLGDEDELEAIVAEANGGCL